MDRDPLYVRTDEAARLTGRKKRSLEKLRREGGGPDYCTPPGRRCVVYSVADLVKWIESGRKTSSSDTAGDVR